MLSRTAADAHARAAAERERLCGVSAVDGDLEGIGAAEERAHRAGLRVGVRRDDLLRRMLVEDEGEDAVVGRDDSVLAGLGGDAAARRADAWIDDDEENGTR